METKVQIGDFIAIACHFIVNFAVLNPVWKLQVFFVEVFSVSRPPRSALAAGFRHIDCAECYGNHDLVGEVIAEWIAAGKGTREELFITNKVPLLPLLTRSCYVYLRLITLNYYYYSNYITTITTLPFIPLSTTMNHLNQVIKLDADIPEMCDSLLSQYGLAYFDLFLLHGMCTLEGEAFKTPLPMVWDTMMSLKRAGKVKEIGVSNWRMEDLESIKEKAMQPACNQVEGHLLLQQNRLYDP